MSLKDLEHQSLENFVLASNRTEGLANFIQGSNQANFYRVLQEIENGNFTTIEQWESGINSADYISDPIEYYRAIYSALREHLSHDDINTVKLRALLKQYDFATPHEKPNILSSLQKWLKLQFNFNKPSISSHQTHSDTEQQFASKLDNSLLTSDISQAYFNPNKFRLLSHKSKLSLDLTKLQYKSVETLLENRHISQFENVPECIATYLSGRTSERINRVIGMLGNLSVRQLEELKSWIPSYFRDHIEFYLA